MPVAGEAKATKVRFGLMKKETWTPSEPWALVGSPLPPHLSSGAGP